MDTVVFGELEPGRARPRGAVDDAPGDPEGPPALIAEGDAGDELYLVQDGIFTVHALKGGWWWSTRKPPGVFGGIPLVPETPRTATVTAKTAGTVWVLTRDDFPCARQASGGGGDDDDGRETNGGFPELRACARVAGRRNNRAPREALWRDSAGARILEQGALCVTRETDDAFFIIVDGEAVVTVDDGECVNGTNVVNRLFRRTFSARRRRRRRWTCAGGGHRGWAGMELRCLALDRENR